MTHPARLGRLPWLFSHNPVFFVTACTAARKPILSHPVIHAAWIEFACRGADYGVFVGRYVWMPDHVHLFAAFRPDAVGVSAWMKSLKNALSKTLREHGVPAPHWQKGFFDHVLRSGESYEAKWEYVRQNPVRAGLCEQPEDWPYQGEIHQLEWENQ